jgi:archaemetzincin
MKYLYIGATAEADAEAVETIRQCLAAAFPLPVRSLDLPPVDFAFDAQRGQHASTAVLEMVVRLTPPDAEKVIGVTSRDLFIPVLTFVFGHAQLSGGAAVVSLARLRQEFYGLEANREVFLARARKEALHEAGHTFGLVHCPDTQCAMSLATGIRQIDRKHAAFCPVCKRRLEIKQ